MGKVRDTIVDAGITPSKVGACFIVHEALGLLRIITLSNIHLDSRYDGNKFDNLFQ